MVEDPTSEAFFEAKYRDNADPWAFATSPYELARYADVTAALGGRRFRRAFEPGCSIGVLTEKLAAVCDRVEALDISPTAVAKAQERCGGLENVVITQGTLPGDLPDGNFDLVTLVEVAYYFEEDVLTRMARQLISQITHGGVLLAEHWRGTSKDHTLHGDRVHDILRGLEGLALETSEINQNYRLDLWRRV